MNFDNVIEAISERAAILKAQGKNSKTQTGNTAKVAAAKTTGPQQYSGVVKNSPPKKQQELPTKPICKLCNLQHKTEDCGKWSQMTVEKRQEELRKEKVEERRVALQERRKVLAARNVLAEENERARKEQEELRKKNSETAIANLIESRKRRR